MSGRELKHPYSGIALPCEVWADPGRHDWYFREKKPDSMARFIREDCTPDPARIRADAIREAAALIHRIADGYAAGGDNAIACGLYLTEGNVLALLDTPLSPTAVDNSPAPDAGGKEGV